jgi:hypothetical protein
MVVEKDCPRVGPVGHPGDQPLTPRLKLLIAVVIIELLLHTPRSPANYIAPMKPDIKQVGVRDNRAGGE